MAIAFESHHAGACGPRRRQQRWRQATRDHQSRTRPYYANDARRYTRSRTCENERSTHTVLRASFILCAGLRVHAANGSVCVLNMSAQYDQHDPFFVTAKRAESRPIVAIVQSRALGPATIRAVTLSGRSGQMTSRSENGSQGAATGRRRGNGVRSHSLARA